MTDTPRPSGTWDAGAAVPLLADRSGLRRATCVHLLSRGRGLTSWSPEMSFSRPVIGWGAPQPTGSVSFRYHERCGTARSSTAVPLARWSHRSRQPGGRAVSRSRPGERHVLLRIVQASEAIELAGGPHFDHSSPLTAPVECGLEARDGGVALAAGERIAQALMNLGFVTQSPIAE